MDKKSIDKFFESYSKDVLKSKWEKYDKYSENENSVTVSELLNVWDFHYENTFVFKEPHSDDAGLNQKIDIKESEITFGLFLYLYPTKNIINRYNESSSFQIYKLQSC